MRKIFYYQCRRLLCNKLFWGLLAVILWYSREVLYGTVIRGVCNTAPFSPWSFGYYLTFLLPFLCAAELFFLSFYTSPAERRVEVLASATPVSPRHYSFSRWGALAVGLLRPDVPLGQLWGTPRPSGFCPGPRPSLLFGGGMVSGKPSPRPSLPAHRLAFLMCLSPAAPLARPSRGALLPHLSPGIGGTGSRLLPPAGCLVGQGGTEYPRPSPPLPHPEKKRVTVKNPLALF